MGIKCFDTPNLKNLWQCAGQKSDSCPGPASVICTGFRRVQLRGSGSNVCSGRLEREEKGSWIPMKNKPTKPEVWCDQMKCGASGVTSVDGDKINLTCSDKVKVVLKDGNSKSECYGAVHFEVNGTTHPVCAAHWTDKEAKIVCQETNCGKMIEQRLSQKRGSGIMDYVRCSGSESSLWHCLAKRDNEDFKCESQAYVVCSDSITARLVDGPGICAGRVEIQHQGKWRRVGKTSWTDANSDTVCRQLGCGNKRKSSTSAEKFSQGSGEFLSLTVQCGPNNDHISECKISAKSRTPGENEAVGITCEDHKVVFLDGEKSCSGMVAIEHDDEMYWLSGSDKTWNEKLANTVCQQMNCGEFSNFNFTSNAELKKKIWEDSYDCLSNSTSLFDCKNTTRPSDHNDTVAFVTCSGRLTVDLTEDCWGYVNICKGEECGGVCTDTWMDEKSDKLCQNLNCGRAIHKAENWPQKSFRVMYKSMHSTKQTTDMSQCNFVKNAEKDSTCQKAAFIVCSDSVKTQITATRDKCSGNVGVFYEGLYLPVCEEALKDEKTKDLICREEGCGHAVSLIKYFGPKPKSLGIQQIQCDDDKKPLRECRITSGTTPCTFVGLQCSRHRTMELKLQTPCSGALVVYSEGERRAVSSEGWTETEGRILCHDLKCGGFSSNRSIEPILENFWNSSFSCAGVNNPQSIWNCENQTVLPKEKQLYIECEEEPNVTLSKKCYGEVKINNIHVCNTHWDMDYSHLVCQEMGCSNAIGSFSSQAPNPDKQYHHVKCEKYHSKLGQCKRFMAKCEGSLVSVSCVGNVKFNTMEKCGGQVQVDYGNKWENVCTKAPMLSKHRKQLCEKLECQQQNTSMYDPANKVASSVILMSCTDAHEDIKYCISQGSCGELKPAEVYCDGYSDNPEEKPTSMVPLILGIAFLLLVVLVLIVVIGVWVVRKSRRAANAKLRKFSQHEAVFESCDYEDLKSTVNETEDFRQSASRPEAELIMERDAQSSSSFHYDDIDESAMETRRLTSPAIPACSSGDSYAREQTYEVDNWGENYDDIEATPETRAEVHNSPRATPENVRAATPGLPERDAEDYLVPGQDR
ncbi:scavenger receptor cysteine-rich type 1 protein M160 [Xyrichtys novacula]|nr:scavenger receptor cysteine-rich type 1 protein M160 [Xyrichtys novacula]